jgi:hypothetical protein
VLLGIDSQRRGETSGVTTHEIAECGDFDSTRATTWKTGMAGIKTSQTHSVDSRVPAETILRCIDLFVKACQTSVGERRLTRGIGKAHACMEAPKIFHRPSLPTQGGVKVSDDRLVDLLRFDIGACICGVSASCCLL